MAGAQIVKWGNSLAVRIPKPLAEVAGLTEGDRVLMEAVDGQIALRRADQPPSLRELVARSLQRTATTRPPPAGNAARKKSNVARYVPRAGDVAWMDFDPQSGRE